MPQSLSAVYVQIVFSTKIASRSWQTETLGLKLHAGLSKISKRLDCPTPGCRRRQRIMSINVRQSRNVTMSDWVRDLKRLSTPWLRKQGAELSEFSWQAGYGAFSVGADGLGAARRYVEQQAEHHRKESFEQELRRLLVEYGMEWNEDYLFD